MMKKIALILILLLLFFPSLSKADNDKDKGFFEKIRSNFELKIRERLDNKEEYNLISSFNNDPYLESEIIFNEHLQTEYIKARERAEKEFEKDFIDSLGYSLNLALRNNPLILKIRMTFQGLNLKITREAGKYNVHLPSLKRQLDPFEEKEAIIELEKKSLEGSGAEIDKKIIELEKEKEKVKKERAKIMPLKIKVGLFTNLKTDQYFQIKEDKKLMLEYGPQLELDILTLENEITYINNNVIELKSLKNFPNLNLMVELQNKHYYFEEKNITELNFKKRLSSSLLMNVKESYDWQTKKNLNEISTQIVLSEKSALDFNAEYEWQDNKYKFSTKYKIKF